MEDQCMQKRMVKEKQEELKEEEVRRMKRWSEEES